MPAASLPKLAAPAQRALEGAGIATLADLSLRSRAEVAALHGMGPTALAALEASLRGAGLDFAEPRLALVKAFLNALSAGESGSALARFYHPQARQVEYPNLLTKVVTERGLAELMVASEKGKAVVRRQTFQVEKAHVTANAVIIEAQWTAELAMAVGKLPAGGKMKAWFAQVYEFQDGLIVAQRNYDCFENFM